MVFSHPFLQETDKLLIRKGMEWTDNLFSLSLSFSHVFAFADDDEE